MKLDKFRQEKGCTFLVVMVINLKNNFQLHLLDSPLKAAYFSERYAIPQTGVIGLMGELRRDSLACVRQEVKNDQNDHIQL